MVYGNCNAKLGTTHPSVAYAEDRKRPSNSGLGQAVDTAPVGGQVIPFMG